MAFVNCGPWSHRADPHPARVPLQTQKVILRQLLLSQPDPGPSHRAENTGDESSSSLLPSDPSVLEASLKEQLSTLQHLHSRMKQAAEQPQLDPAWEDIHDGLSELGAVVWALSTVLGERQVAPV